MRARSTCAISACMRSARERAASASSRFSAASNAATSAARSAEPFALIARTISAA
jgi:hypothetical protein